MEPGDVESAKVLPVFTIEFRTTLKDGVVVVPPEPLDKFSGVVKVVLMADAPGDTPVDVLGQLLAQPLHVPGFKPLGRDEVHTR